MDTDTTTASSWRDQMTANLPNHTAWRTNAAGHLIAAWTTPASIWSLKHNPVTGSTDIDGAGIEVGLDEHYAHPGLVTTLLRTLGAIPTTDDPAAHTRCRQMVNAHAAGARQLLAEFHHLKEKLILGRPDEDLITVGGLRQVLRDGPGLLGDDTDVYDAPTQAEYEEVRSDLETAASLLVAYSQSHGGTLAGDALLAKYGWLNAAAAEGDEDQDATDELNTILDGIEPPYDADQHALVVAAYAAALAAGTAVRTDTGIALTRADRDEAITIAEDALAAIHSSADITVQGEQPGATWRDYTIERGRHSHPDSNFIVCRSDDTCDEVLENEEGTHLTLGQAHDWATKHAAHHAQSDAEADLLICPRKGCDFTATDEDALGVHLVRTHPPVPAEATA